MIRIEYPKYDFRFKEEENKEFIFDDIRKQWLRLTPEEWVRQNFIRYLNEEKQYPLSLISVESSFSLYKLDKRSDILVHNRKGAPVAMVECKSTDVKINKEVFEQIVRYNLKYQLAFLIVTNGLQHFCCK